MTPEGNIPHPSGKIPRLLFHRGWRHAMHAALLRLGRVLHSLFLLNFVVVAFLTYCELGTFTTLGTHSGCSRLNFIGAEAQARRRRTPVAWTEPPRRLGWLLHDPDIMVERSNRKLNTTGMHRKYLQHHRAGGGRMESSKVSTRWLKMISLMTCLITS
jgi:hypothetical protein